MFQAMHRTNSTIHSYKYVGIMECQWANHMQKCGLLKKARRREHKQVRFEQRCVKLIAEFS